MEATGDKRYFDYVEEWGDTIINDKGEIYKYDMATYNLDFINPGKVLFDLYRETHDVKYKKAMDVLVKQLEHHPRTLKGGFGINLSISIRCGGWFVYGLSFSGSIRCGVQSSGFNR